MRRRRAAFAAIITLGMLASACSDVKPALEIHLDDPEPVIANETAAQPSESRVLRLAISGVLSTQEAARTYGDLVGYLERRLDRPVEVIQKRTYSEINDLLEEGVVQVGLVCTLPYVVGHDRFGLELLAAPEIDDDIGYFTYLVVPAESGATSLADLKGTTFAFSDPLSTSGHLVPVFELSKLGYRPDEFFRRTLFTYSHDNSLHSVAEGLVDGATIARVVYERMVAADPDIGRATRVIAQWGPFGTPPLVATPSLDPALKEELREIFLSMQEDPEGTRILRGIGATRFVTVNDSDYESIRQMWRAVGGEL